MRMVVDLNINLLNSDNLQHRNLGDFKIHMFGTNFKGSNKVFISI